MKPLTPLLLVLTLPWSAAQADGVAAGHVPTRMQMCQHELQALPAEQRPSEFKACLQRRAKAEAAIERDCRRSSNAVQGESTKHTTQLRREAMRNCLANGLSRPYAELPVGGTRPAARAATAPAPARKPAQPAVVPAANSASPRPVQPAAGESSAR
ncbi:hypothetical protein [Comamonas serinivorans]|uniref:hypothetical protein n=1 Tax=Comamonas serinivorans TaxID=1082851 RepID=UPI0012F999E1|nr:hypothetical protein [Comamonas serinivorans]